MTNLYELEYANRNGLPLFLDVTIPDKATPDAPAPILIFYHGGGLLQGTRKGQAPHHDRAPEKHGIAIVSIDYRLAPQTRLPGILADMSAAMAYLRSPAFASATARRVDASRIIVGGGSAGGWQALMIGLGVGFEASGVETPALVRGVAAMYPISDLSHPFWTTKQHPVSYFPRVIKAEELGAHLDPSSAESGGYALDDPRSVFYHYMVQEGILADLLLDGTGISPDAFSIPKAIKDGKARFTPTFITHGSNDDKVPIAQAEAVVDALKAAGQEVTYERVEGADHLFDRAPANDMEAMYDWVVKILK